MTHTPTRATVPGPAANVSPARPGTTRPTKIDWEQAFSALVADPTLGYTGVARRFSVSLQAVRKHAAKHDWQARLEAARAQAAAKAEAEAIRSLEERNRRTLQAVEKARDHLLSGSADPPKWSDLPGLVKLEQLIEGEATDRISIPEVRDFVARLATGVDAALREVLDTTLANGKRAVVLREFRARFGPLLEQAATGLAIEAGDPA